MNKYLFTFIFIFTLLILPKVVEAQTSQAVFILSPNTGSFSLNDTIPVDLNIDATNSTGVTSVKSHLTFDKDLLEVVSLDSSQSSFAYQWEQAFDNANGTIHIQRSSSTPRLGNHLITKIIFRAKSSGTATLAYDSNCFAFLNPTCLALKPDDTNILNPSQSSSFTITTSYKLAPTSVVTPNPNIQASYGGLYLLLLVGIILIVVAGIWGYKKKKRG